MAPLERLLCTCLCALLGTGAVAAELPSEIKRALSMRDYEQALPWLRREAAGGDARATFELAKLYRIGAGVEKDAETSSRYLEAAASGGIVEAQYLLALHHDRLGASAEARHWLSAAAAAGHDKARQRLQREPARGRMDVWTAIRLGAVPTAALLADAKGQRDANGRTALIAAAQAGAARWVEALAETAELDARDDIGNTALHHAVAIGASDLVGSLLQAGASPSVAAANGATPLHLAVAAGDVSSTERLLAAGADRELQNAAGFSATMLAGRSETPAMRRLLDVSDNVPRSAAQRFSRVEDLGPLDQLFLGAQQGDLDLVRRQVDAGQPLHTRDDAGLTALARATTQGHAEVVAFLVARGAQADETVLDGRTLLHVAVDREDRETLGHLLRGTKHVDALAGRDALTALMHAAKNDCGICARMLLEAGAAPAAVSGNHETALIIALRRGALDVAERLAETGAGLDAIDADSRSALWWAAKLGHRQLVSALLNGQHGLVADTLGVGPLHVAAAAGHAAVVEELLDHVAVDVETATGNTALMLAAAANSADVVSVLLQAGARVDQTNSVGDTALIAAVRGAAYETSAQLITAGASTRVHNDRLESARTLIAVRNDPRWRRLLEGGAAS